MASTKITLTFDESDPVQMMVFSYLKSQNRGKSKLITELVAEHIKRTDMVGEIKLKVLEEILEDEAVVSAIRQSKSNSNAKVKEERTKSKEAEPPEENEGVESGIDMSYLMKSASFAM